MFPWHIISRFNLILTLTNSNHILYNITIPTSCFLLPASRFPLPLGKNGIMFSSDVSARGLDYPDVSFVLQVGITEREQYIHRLGRTARAGKSGHGGLLLAPYEEKCMKKALSDMPLIITGNKYIPSSTTITVMNRGINSVNGHNELKKSAEQAYGAWLGYYNSNLRNCGWNKEILVQYANAMSTYFGLKNQPKLLKKTVGKMGLKGVPGLETE